MIDENLYVFKLSRPLHTHGGDVTELNLKEPSAGTFLRAKADPFKSRQIDDEHVEYTFDSAACAAFLCDMTGLDQIIIESLPAADFMGLRWRLILVIAAGLGGNFKNPSQASAA